MHNNVHVLNATDPYTKMVKMVNFMSCIFYHKTNFCGSPKKSLWTKKNSTLKKKKLFFNQEISNISLSLRSRLRTIILSPAKGQSHSFKNNVRQVPL